MKTLTAPIPPKLKEAGWIVGVKLTIFSTLMNSDGIFFPESNMIGTIILAHFFIDALIHKGVLQREPAPVAPNATPWQAGGQNELNDFYGLFAVSNPQIGAQTIAEALATIGLKNFAEIAWFDDREGVWRPFWPENLQLDFGRHESPPPGDPGLKT